MLSYAEPWDGMYFMGGLWAQPVDAPALSTFFLVNHDHADMDTQNSGVITSFAGWGCWYGMLKIDDFININYNYAKQRGLELAVSHPCAKTMATNKQHDIPCMSASLLCHASTRVHDGLIGVLVCN